MESLNHAVRMMTPNCYMASIDFAHGYYSVPVHEDFQKYLKFEFQGDYFKFTVFPNGLACCARMFTKFLKPAYAHLRLQGFESVSFIDDSWLNGPSYEECQSNVVASCTLFQKLGFIIHPQKSVLIPVQDMLFRIFVLNSVSMTVKLTPEKVQHISLMCPKLLGNAKPSIQFVSEIIGLLISALPGVGFGQLHYRSLEIDRNNALKLHSDNYKRKMCISTESKADLQWWIDVGVHSPVHIHLQWWIDVGVHSPVHITQDKPSIRVQCDESNTGWGTDN